MHVSNFCMCFEKLHLMKDSCSTSHKWHLYVDCFPLKMRYCEIIGRRNWDVRWARCLLAHTSFSKWQILSSSAFIRTEVSQCVLKKNEHEHFHKNSRSPKYECGWQPWSSWFLTKRYQQAKFLDICWWNWCRNPWLAESVLWSCCFFIVIG